ncbi:MAG: hypothetical protein U0T36_13365 [Saprospiraceae bacterium]
MRIILEFDLEDIKVTVFKMDDKISVKYEWNLLEQTLKFRDGSTIQSANDAKKFSENQVLNLKSIFEKMNEMRWIGINEMINDSHQEWDEII